MGVPGVDYALLGTMPGQDAIERFKKNDLPQCGTGAEHGLTYQVCRCCRRGWPELPYLLKYATRCYVCEDCRAHYAEVGRGRKR